MAFPHLLTGERVALLHRMSRHLPLYTPDLAGERMSMDDMIQRIYSDDGHGSGRVTLQGLGELNSSTPRHPGEQQFPDAARVAALPAAAALMASRADVTAQANRFYDLAASDAQMPAWQRHTQARADSTVIAFLTDPANRLRYALLSAMMPSLDRAMDVMDTARAQHEALMTALALDVYRDKVGRYPATLAELVPQYMPAVPLDQSTGQPLRFKLVNDKPVLYGLGWDGKDDGGVWTDRKTHWPNVPDIGDWVLYPPRPEE